MRIGPVPILRPDSYRSARGSNAKRPCTDPKTKQLPKRARLHAKRPCTDPKTKQLPKRAAQPLLPRRPRRLRRILPPPPIRPFAPVPLLLLAARRRRRRRLLVLRRRCPERRRAAATYLRTSLSVSARLDGENQRTELLE